MRHAASLEMLNAKRENGTAVFPFCVFWECYFAPGVHLVTSFFTGAMVLR